MKYVPIEMTERIQRIKDAYRELPVPSMKDPYHPEHYRPYGSGDRMMTLGFLRGFEKHKLAPTARLRKSYAEAEELYQSEPKILDDELLLGHVYLPDFSEEEQAEYDRLCEGFEMSVQTLAMRPPRRDHICLDLEKLLRVGVNGLRAEIRQKMDEVHLGAGMYPQMDEVKKSEFYQCCLIELDAVSDLAARYSQAALKMAEKKDEPRKSELVVLGNMLRKVPDEPAGSFYEALQSVQFFLSTLFGLYPLGRPDRYLYPYFKRNMERGELSREFAQELIDNFCLCVSDRVFSRSACGFIVGGTDEQGELVENELTYMFLTALDHLKLPDPNGALAVSRKTGGELLEYCVEILSHGTSHPAFYNDEAIIGSLIKNYQVAPADAVSYIHSTCAEISVIGKSKAHSTPFVIDLPEMLCSAAQKEGVSSFRELYAEFISNIREFVIRQSTNYAYRMLEGARVGNEAMRASVLTDDCIARGKSIYEGGERYMFLQPIFIGFGTAVDSLVALRTLVYEDKRLTLDEFNEIIDGNFENNEPLRQYIIRKLSHYGNDNPIADGIAEELASSIQAAVGGEIPFAEQMMAGTFSYINHATHGAKSGATFDGRLAGNAYSDGCCPVQGRDVNGPTAMVTSLTSWDQSKLLGGMVVNLKFGKSHFCGKKSGNLTALIRAFIERGGIELQVNMVDRATLEDAVIHPEAHGNLIVRIGGYSDYFVRLNPVLQKEVIERTEY